jgi:uncharacterized protein YkwD
MHVVRAAVAVLGLVALLALGVVPAGAEPGANEVLEAAVVAEINSVREAEGVRPMTRAAGLERSSEAHALAMASDGFFSHTSLDGTSFAERIRDYYPRNGSRRYAVGETLYWSAHPVTASSVVGWWLASGSHRSTLLAGRFGRIGVAAVEVPGAPGVFGGRNVTIVVVDYGGP